MIPLSIQIGPWIVIDHMLALARIICKHGSSQAAVVVESKSMLKLILGTLLH